MWVYGILAARSMQNPKKYANGFQIIISEYIRLIILYAHLGISANLQFCWYKNITSIDKNVRSSFLLLQYESDGGRLTK